MKTRQQRHRTPSHGPPPLHRQPSIKRQPGIPKHKNATIQPDNGRTIRIATRHTPKPRISPNTTTAEADYPTSNTSAKPARRTYNGRTCTQPDMRTGTTNLNRKLAKPNNYSEPAIADDDLHHNAQPEPSSTATKPDECLQTTRRWNQRQSGPTTQNDRPGATSLLPTHKRPTTNRLAIYPPAPSEHAGIMRHRTRTNIAGRSPTETRDITAANPPAHPARSDVRPAYVNTRQPPPQPSPHTARTDPYIRVSHRNPPIPTPEHGAAPLAPRQKPLYAAREAAPVPSDENRGSPRPAAARQAPPKNALNQPERRKGITCAMGRPVRPPPLSAIRTTAEGSQFRPNVHPTHRCTTGRAQDIQPKMKAIASKQYTDRGR